MKKHMAALTVLAACVASAQEQIAGYQTFEIQKGTNVLSELIVGTPDGCLLAHPLKRQLFKYKIGDTFLWTLDGKKCVYRFDGEHWYDADGKNADNVIFPSLRAGITLVREVDEQSRVSISGQVRQDLTDKINAEIRNRYKRPANAHPASKVYGNRGAANKVAVGRNLPPPGYVPVEIKKGKTVIDPLFVDPRSIGQTMTTVKKQGWDVKKGDSISWCPGKYEVKCTFDGERWNSPCNQATPDLVIPLGKFPLTVERVVDETSTFNVSGWCDVKKAEKMGAGNNKRTTSGKGLK